MIKIQTLQLIGLNKGCLHRDNVTKSALNSWLSYWGCFEYHTKI